MTPSLKVTAILSRGQLGWCSCGFGRHTLRYPSWEHVSCTHYFKVELFRFDSLDLTFLQAVHVNMNAILRAVSLVYEGQDAQLYLR
jgi:hypothetical protein